MQPSKCPICGRRPKWDLWTAPIGENQQVLLWALECNNDGNHSCFTDYYKDKEDTIIEWERIVKEKECKLKGD